MWQFVKIHLNLYKEHSFQDPYSCYQQNSGTFTFHIGFMKEHIPIEEGDFYWSKEGYRVFTEQFHRKRGYCCESGCRHCPYGYDPKTNTQ